MDAPSAITFDQAGDFSALHAAERALKESGFSVGTVCRGLPCAVMFGDYVISKWRNLDQAERRETHATLDGDFRNGPLALRLLPAAPVAAVEAFSRLAEALGSSQ